jgi:hypothetical protein
LLHLAGLGAAALAADDPDLDAERAVMAEYYAAEPSDRPYVPGDPDPLRDGLLAGARGWVLSVADRMRAAKAQRFASGRGEKWSYTPARRHIPPEERLEGEVCQAAGSEFRRE